MASIVKRAKNISKDRESLTDIRSSNSYHGDNVVTKEELINAFPNKKRAITDDLVNVINQSINDPEFQGESLFKVMISYQGILENANVSLVEYVNAIKFCSYLVTSEDNYTLAYVKTFSDRDFVRKRMNADTSSGMYKELTNAASRYSRSSLVTKILTLSQAPLELFFTGARFKAVGILAEIMKNSRLDRDRINAAKELLAATKGPENVKVELDIGVKGSSALEKLNEQLGTIAKNSLSELEKGTVTLDDLGGIKVPDDRDIIDVDVEE